MNNDHTKGINILNEDKSDLGYSGELMNAACFLMLYASELLCYKIIKNITAWGITKSLYHQKKMHFTKGRTMIEGGLKHLECSFDSDVFEYAGCTFQKHNKLHVQSNQVARFVVLILDKLEAGHSYDTIFDKINELKGSNCDGKLDAVVELFNKKPEEE